MLLQGEKLGCWFISMTAGDTVADDVVDDGEGLDPQG